MGGVFQEEIAESGGKNEKANIGFIIPNQVIARWLPGVQSAWGLHSSA
jgi:hypothetical protein